MSEWQPIETAPVGVSVMIWAEGHEPVSAILQEYDKGHPGHRFRWDTSAELMECAYLFINFDPTHWMPLPPPPEEA